MSRLRTVQAARQWECSYPKVTSPITARTLILQTRERRVLPDPTIPQIVAREQATPLPHRSRPLPRFWNLAFPGPPTPLFGPIAVDKRPFSAYAQNSALFNDCQRARCFLRASFSPHYIYSRTTYQTPELPPARADFRPVRLLQVATYFQSSSKVCHSPR